MKLELIKIKEIFLVLAWIIYNSLSVRVLVILRNLNLIFKQSYCSGFLATTMHYVFSQFLLNLPSSALIFTFVLIFLLMLCILKISLSGRKRGNITRSRRSAARFAGFPVNILCEPRELYETSAGQNPHVKKATCYM